MDTKNVVGVVQSKEEGKGRVVCSIDVGTKYPFRISAFTESRDQPGVATPIVAQLEAIKPGMKVSADYTETPGKNQQGVAITWKNLVSISIATDATEIKPPANLAVPQKHAGEVKQTYGKSPEESRRVAYGAAGHDAAMLLAPALPLIIAEKGLGWIQDSDNLSELAKAYSLLKDYIFDLGQEAMKSMS